VGGWLVAVCAEFDQYREAPLHYCRIGLQINYRHLLQETRHVSSPFITTGPHTDLASPGDIKLLNRSGPVFYGSFNRSNFYSVEVKLICMCDSHRSDVWSRVVLWLP